MAMVQTFLERSDPGPRTVRLTIVARDPAVLDPRATDPARRILRAEVDVPSSHMLPGPRGPRFHVVDFDATSKHLAPQPAAVDATFVPRKPDEHDPFWGMSDAELLASPAFRAHNVYAITARTLARFEQALGRPVPWAFGNSQLYVVPTAFAEANAYYADDDQALYFGYFGGGPVPMVYTCLAHDIVVHETSHAVLDGLRRRFDVPSFPDQAGFHEGFADVVALLSQFELTETLELLLGTEPRLPKASVSHDALRSSVLLGIGKQFGDAIHRTRGGALRQSVEMPPTTAWLDPTKLMWQEPHRRGEILAAACMQAFLGVWEARLAPITGEDVDRDRAAEEGAKAARHLLEMAIRAIDYCPPVDFTFRDFLRAMLSADEELVPDDALGYRKAVIEAFGRFGMVAPPVSPLAIADKDYPSYRSFSYASLRSDPDEAFRFLWDNAGLFGIDRDYYLHVENVRPSVRVGPRGFVVAETLVDYVQELILTRTELDELCRKAGLDRRVPAAIPGATKIKLYGGGVIVFDEFGAIKHHHAKPLADWGRQLDRLEYLVARGQWDTKGRIGFSTGDSPGQRFAALHSSGGRWEEEW